MTRRLALVLFSLTASCSQASTGPEGDVDARWKLKAGDVLRIRYTWRSDGAGRNSGAEMDGVFRVRELDAEGKAVGLVETKRFAAHEEPGGMHVLFEGGEFKELRGMDRKVSGVWLEGFKKKTEAVLLPNGLLRAPDSVQPMTFSSWPLGVELPGKTVPSAASWKGRIRVAHDDELEVEYRFTSAGDRVSIEGRSSAEAEERQKIRVRVQGTFVPAQGIVTEGTIEIDFSALGTGGKTTVRFALTK